MAVENGFRVVSCRTFDTNVQLLGDTAVVTHSVETRISTNEGEDTVHERETIVMARGAAGAGGSVCTSICHRSPRLARTV